MGNAQTSEFSAEDIQQMKEQSNCRSSVLNHSCTLMSDYGLKIQQFMFLSTSEDTNCIY